MAVLMAPPASSAHADSTTVLHLFGGPAITIAHTRHAIPDGSKRLVALLALDRRRLDRRYVAGTLWPDSDESHAAGCLRTALWRLRQAGLDIVVVTKSSLELSGDTRVDALDALAWAARVIAGQPAANDLRWPDLRVDALDFLPGWYDDWVEPHREHLRQRVLHALDRMSDLLSESGHHADAVEAAYTAVACEPLRESAQRALIRAHLAEGNVIEARRSLERYERALVDELDILPHDELYRLVGLAPAVAPPRLSRAG